jgi:caa(3)-type oxidase subunit IV
MTPAATPSPRHPPAAGPSSVRVWATLTGLLAVSVAGPFLGVRLLTLLTAFGIAIVKAYLVARHFMHVGLERRFVVYLLVAMLALILVMIGGVAPDVMKHEGARWENRSAAAAVERGEAEARTAHAP